MSNVLAIAVTEIRIGSRNRWVILTTGILLLFALILAVLGTAPGGEVDVQRLTITVASLATLSVYLVPLIALLLAFDTIAGEVERGTLPLLLATPVSRGAVIVGKFLGQLFILALAVSMGYGLAGALVMLFSGQGLAGAGDLARLIATSIALGGVFLAFGTIASACVRSSGMAAALAVGIWLIAVVLYDLGLLAALIADADGMFAKSVFPYLLVANPADAFRLYNLAMLETGQETTGFADMTRVLPFAATTALTGLIGWGFAALGAAIALFRRVQP